MMYGIILIAIVVAFIILQLVRVLGTRSNEDEERIRRKKELFQDLGQESSLAKSEEETHFVKTEEFSPQFSEKFDEKLVPEFIKIKKMVRTFEPEDFLERAQQAFSTIMEAYAQGDVDTLKKLCGTRIFELFEQTIVQRNQDKHVMNWQLLGIKIDYHNLDINDSNLIIPLKISSEQSISIVDENDNLISGSRNKVINITELWFFEYIKGKGTWLLSSTKTI